jgi:adenine-specific DNA-methyltransferase
MTDLDALDLLDREDLIATVKRMVNGGVSLGFHGKRTAMNIMRKVRPRVTRRVKELHVGTPQEQAKNLLIEGENLQAMVTLYKYRGQVDLIVTDPPYNTGQHFRYNDRWDEDPNDPELGSLVTMEDGSRHTKWMKALLPRLQMMKAMLKPQGVIAVCIDDNELFHLGMMNRLGIINWQKTYSPKNNVASHLSVSTEYVLVYARDKELAKTKLLARTDETNAKYSNPDKDPRGLWRSDNITGPGASTHWGQVYAIQSPFTGEMILPPEGRCWAAERKRMKDWIQDWGTKYEDVDLNDGRAPAMQIVGDIEKAKKRATARMKQENWPQLHFLKNGLGKPSIKRYLNEVKKGVVPMTFWADEDYEEPLEIGAQSWQHAESGHSQAGINELTSIVGRGHDFATVKPLRLIKKIIQLWCPPNGLVLDPYAGSGTTGQAVLELNKEAGTDRRFILVEQGRPDNGDKYARTLTWQRLNNVITGERPDKSGKLKKLAEPLPGGFEFRMLTSQIDAKTVLSMKKDELVDVVITSHWETGSRNSPNLIRIEDPKFTYLVGKNDLNEGYFIIWNNGGPVGQVDVASYSLVLQEAKKAALKPPYHVYARYEVYQSKNVRFYKIPDKILAHLGLNENSDPYNDADEEGND